MNDKKEELKYLALDIIEKMETAERQMDFSINSVKHLDNILDKAVKNGKYLEPKSVFAICSEHYLACMGAYITAVILYNTTESSLQIDDEDRNWKNNYYILAKNEKVAYPSQLIDRRVLYSDENNLYNCVVNVCNSFENI